MQKTVGSILSLLEGHAPSATAESWDNVGLLLGDPAWKTSGAVVSIDLTSEAIQLAESSGVHLIINHHPCIFPKSGGLTRVAPGASGTLSSLMFECLQKQIAVISCHTNFDRCALEVIQKVSEGLGVVPAGRLVDPQKNGFTKLVTFVPETHLEKVRTAVCEAGAGHIGNYDFCTFTMKGRGTFRGNDQTQPFLGKPGELEEAEELRFETIFPKGLERAVLDALKKAHPYEEIAFDLYPVEQSPAKLGLTRGVGYGFWGDCAEEVDFSEIEQCVKSLFDLNGYWVTEPRPTRVKRIAFCAGNGGSFIRDAISKKVDLFIVGEAGYHKALEGSRNGMAVMEIGHRESEKFFVKVMEMWLATASLSVKTLLTRTQNVVAVSKDPH